MIDFNAKIPECPRCRGTAYLATHIAYSNGDYNMTIRCDYCGLELNYSKSPLFAPDVCWTYHLQENRDILDVWEKGDLDEYKHDEQGGQI